MFGFFKDKLKGIVGKFSQKVEEEVNDDFDSKHYYDDEIKTQDAEQKSKETPEESKVKETEEQETKPVEEKTEDSEEKEKEPEETEQKNQAEDIQKTDSAEKKEEAIESDSQEAVKESENKDEEASIKSETIDEEAVDSDSEQVEADETSKPALSEKVSDVDVSKQEVEEKQDLDHERAEKIKEEMKRKFREDIYKKYNITPTSSEKEEALVEAKDSEKEESVEQESEKDELENKEAELPEKSHEDTNQELVEEVQEEVKEEIKEQQEEEPEAELAEPEQTEDTEAVESTEDEIKEETIEKEETPQETAQDTTQFEVKQELTQEETQVEEKENQSEDVVEQKKSDDELNNQIHSLETENLFEQVDEGKPIEYEEEKKGFFGKLKDKFFKKEEDTTVEKISVKEIEHQQEVKQEKEAEKAEHLKEKVEQEIKEIQEKPKEIETVTVSQTVQKAEPTAPVQEEKTGFFGKIKNVLTSKTLDESKFEELFFDLEIALLENNVALAVIDKIKQDLKSKLVDQKLNRFQIEKIIAESLESSITELFDIPSVNLIEEIKSKSEKPYVISFVGINGVGKTTNLAKVANYLKKKDLSVLMVAADTFRAAAIEQIQEHADNLDIKLIKHDYGSDAAAVCFDAIKHAKSKNMDVVLIDTAGRSNANQNLMNELEKVIRVSKSDLTLFVGDSLTGNDAVDQAENFNEKVGIDGVILSKADADDKGGTAISIGWILKKPILFIGTGQTYDDLELFSPQLILRNLGFE